MPNCPVCDRVLDTRSKRSFLSCDGKCDAKEEQLRQENWWQSLDADEQWITEELNDGHE